MSDQVKNEEIGKRYLSITEYAAKCNVSYHAIHARIIKSNEGRYNEGDEMYLEETDLEEVEGVFIDTHKFPPKKGNPGRKQKKNA